MLRDKEHLRQFYSSEERASTLTALSPTAFREGVYDCMHFQGGTGSESLINKAEATQIYSYLISARVFRVVNCAWCFPKESPFEFEPDLTSFLGGTKGL